MYNPQNNTWGFAVVSTNGLFDGVAASPVDFGRGSDTTPNWFSHIKTGNIGLLDIYAIAKECAASLVYPAGDQISSDFFPSYVQSYRDTKNVLTPFLLHRVSIVTVAAGTPTLKMQKVVAGVDQNGGILSVTQSPIIDFPVAVTTAPLFVTDYACRILTPGDVLIVNNTGGVAGAITILVELMPLDTGESFVRACCSCPVTAAA